MSYHSNRNMEPVSEISQINPEYTFDNYRVKSGNRFASLIAIAVAHEPPGSLYNPLLICGREGLGKTHLMHAIANEILELRPWTSIDYIPAEDMIDMQIDRAGLFRHDVLLFEDIQFVFANKAVRDMITQLFKDLIWNRKQVVISLDHVPAEYSTTLNDHLKSLLQSGLIAEIREEDGTQ